MKLLGLNSPEIFIILVVLLSILGPKRIENGFLLFKKLLKFLLSKEEALDEELKAEEPKESEVKEEALDVELKAEEPEESEVKEEALDEEVKPEKKKKSKS